MPFAPTDIASLAGWWDATAITGKADGDSVTSWPDSSSAAHPLSTLIGTAPKYKTNMRNGKPAVQFSADGALDATGALIADQTYTLVMVMATRGSSGTYQFFMSNQHVTNRNGGAFGIVSASNTRGLYGVGSYVDMAGGVYTHTTYERWVLTSNGSNATLHVNNVLKQTSAAMLAGGTVRVGGASRTDGTGTEFLATINVCEVLAFDAALSSTDRTDLDNYLGSKWGFADVVKSGSGTGALTWAGSATGKKVAAGVAAGVLAFTGAAVGAKTPKASATGTATWAGSAAGLAPAPGAKQGSATGSLAWTGTAAGAPASRAGSAAGSFLFAGAASGTNAGIPLGQSTGSYTWAGQAAGANGTTTIPVDDVELDFDTSDDELELIPPLAPAPAGVVLNPIMRRSVIVPNLRDVPGVIIDPVTGQPRIPAEIYATFPVIEEEVGVPHVIFPDRDATNDATFYRRNRTRIISDRREEPFGDASAQVEIPAITSMDNDPDGNGSPHPWTKIRANLEIVLRKSDATITREWSGNVFSRNVGNDGKNAFLRLTALGSLRMAGNAINKPLTRQDPLDLGYLIPRTANTVISRRYNAIPHVTTGILSKKRGTWSDNALGFMQECLADAWTLSGNQWTIAKIPGSRRAYEMRLKKTMPSWTITNGAIGVSIDFTKDGAVRNVIYGHGVNDDGGVWRNTYYFDGADPNDGIRLPLAADPRTQKRILNSDATGLVDNPDYDETVPVYEDDVDFGQNSRTIGIRSAEQIVDRESTPYLTGRITLETDPREGSRFHIPPGDKIKVIGYEGRDVIMHIPAVERTWEDGTVTLEVTERAHDALTLAQIRTLQKEARRDPAMRPGNPNRRSRLEQDQVTPFDADSTAGHILPRTAPGNQWSGESKGWPFAGAGRIVKTHFEAGAPFAVMITARQVPIAVLSSRIGNPLTSDRPFEPHLQWLENAYGMVACWGQKGQRMGYSPGQEAEGDPFTGDFDEYSTWEYVSGAGVKLWVYVFPAVTTTFSGRCYPGSEL